MRDHFDEEIFTEKKKRVNSKRKGNKFENDIAKKFNARFNTKDFCRTPGSGAFATTHSLPEHLKVYGDLITPSNFKFVLECKKGYNKENLSSLFNHKSEIFKFIKQGERDAEFSGREFMVIYQQDRGKVLVITKEDSFPKTESSVLFSKYKIDVLDDLLNLDDYYWH